MSSVVWEYWTHSMYPNSNVEGVLNAFGAKGWELVAVWDKIEPSLFIFKRVKWEV